MNFLSTVSQSVIKLLLKVAGLLGPYLVALLARGVKDALEGDVLPKVRAYMVALESNTFLTGAEKAERVKELVKAVYDQQRKEFPARLVNLSIELVVNEWKANNFKTGFVDYSELVRLGLPLPPIMAAPVTPPPATP